MEDGLARQLGLKAVGGGREGPSAVIVTVGDEILLGDTVDTNAAWLGRELAGAGLPVVRRYTVGDDDRHICHAVTQALEEGDVVLVTGGLGPTSDDRTRPAVADLLEAPLELDEELLEELRRYFRERGFDEMPERNVSQAMVPRGARVLPNEWGTAPGLALWASGSPGSPGSPVSSGSSGSSGRSGSSGSPNPPGSSGSASEAPSRERGTGGGAWVILLPGVPREMRGIFAGSVLPLIRETLGAGLRPVIQRRLHTTGISESELAKRVDDALPDDTGPVTVAFLPDLRGVTLRLTARGADSAGDAERWLDRVGRALTPVVEPYRFDADESGDLVEAVSRVLEEQGLMVATAESCTGGLIAKRLTDRPGSSRVFAGGVVAYADAVKAELLGVEPAVLERAGAVSEEVARQMAVGVAERLGVACGIGITGIAGPGGGSEEKPVGLVWYAASVGGEVAAERQLFGGDREAVRERSAQAALALFRRRLLRWDGDGAESGGWTRETEEAGEARAAGEAERAGGKSAPEEKGRRDGRNGRRKGP